MSRVPRELRIAAEFYFKHLIKKDTDNNHRQDKRRAYQLVLDNYGWRLSIHNTDLADVKLITECCQPVRLFNWQKKSATIGYCEYDPDTIEFLGCSIKPAQTTGFCPITGLPCIPARLDIIGKRYNTNEIKARWETN